MVAHEYPITAAAACARVVLVLERLEKRGIVFTVNFGRQP